MNAKIIEGLKVVKEGIDLILEGYALDTVIPAEPEEVKKASAPNTLDKTSEKLIKEETPKTETIKGNLTREQLEGMTYNNIKKLAKEMGVSAVGNREEITARILGEEVEVEAEDVVEEAPETVEVDEKDNDPLYAKVIDAVADMSNEEIADILADCGIPAKGKREALIEKVVEAVRDGAIDFDDEEEEAPAPAKKTKKEPAPAPVEEEEDEEEDLTNDIDNPNMTEARKDAILEQDSDIRKQFKKGEVTRDNLVEFLQSFYDTDEDMEEMSDDEILDTYIDAVCRLIDDEGDLIEEGAYTLNGEPACCGRVLSYSEDTGMFICEHCGEEYEAEE